MRAALLSSGLPWPMKRITVNLAPSGVRKGGAGLDLAIAMGVLVASDAVPAGSLAGLAFLGELGLDGSIRRIPGVVPLVDALGEHGAVVPAGCETEAKLVGESRRASRVLVDRARRRARRSAGVAVTRPRPSPCRLPEPGPDLAEVRGHAVARLAVEAAAAGGHHLLLLGPSRSGQDHAGPAAAGPPSQPGPRCVAPDHHDPLGRRPAASRRAGHAAAAAGAASHGLAGGDGRRGTASMRPGEVSLSNGGILFLDELGEFQPAVLDGLRQPWRRASSGSPGPGRRWSSRPASSWWPP